MKIMILGSGAREYSIALALRRVDKNLEFYFAPGNGATESLGTNLNLKDPVVLATPSAKKLSLPTIQRSKPFSFA